MDPSCWQINVCAKDTFEIKSDVSTFFVKVLICLDVTYLVQELFPVLKSSTSHVQVHLNYICALSSKVFWIHSSLHDLGGRGTTRVDLTDLPLHMNILHSHCTQRQSVLKDCSCEDETANALIVYAGKLFILCTNKKLSRRTGITTNFPGLKLGNLHEDLMPLSETFPECRGLCHCSCTNQNSFKAQCHINAALAACWYGIRMVCDFGVNCTCSTDAICMLITVWPFAFLTDSLCFVQMRAGKSDPDSALTHHRWHCPSSKCAVNFSLLHTNTNTRTTLIKALVQEQPPLLPGLLADGKAAAQLHSSRTKGTDVGLPHTF